jgi:tetratricopeptide (TPR) repeat protein
MNRALGQDQLADFVKGSGQSDPMTRLESLLHMERALQVALEGNYRSAESELALAEPIEWNNPSFHDLRAKIFAQQRRFGEAETSWRAALQLDPENEAYQKGLARVHEDMAKPPFLRWPLSAVARLLLGLFGLAAIICTLGYARRISDSLADLSAKADGMSEAQVAQEGRAHADLLSSSGEIIGAISDSTATIQGNLEDLDDQITSMSGELSEIGAQQDASFAELANSRPPQPEVSLDGITLVTTESGYRLVFERALFAQGSSFEPGALDRIRQLSSELAGMKDQYLIVVTGYVDASECLTCYSIPLHLLRSEAVIQNLLDTGYFTEADVMIGFPGTGEKPYPEDTQDSAARNRTVVIDLIPREG